MAAKRRRFSSSSSSSRSKAPKGRRSHQEPVEKGLKADRDGRYSVTCPKCSAGYRVPEDLLDQRLTCKSCKSVFTPQTVLSKVRRPRKKDYSGLVAAGVGAVLLVVALIVINAVQKKEKKVPASQPVVETLTMLHPSWLAWARFCDAMRSKDQIALLSSLDVEAYYKRTKDKKARDFDRLEREAMAAWKDKTAQGLFNDPEWQMLQKFEPSGPNTFPKTPKNTRDLSFESIMTPPDRKEWQGNGIIQVLMIKTEQGIWKVRSFETIKEARMKTVAKSGRKVGYHKKLGKGEMETVKDSTGRTFKVRVIQPQPLEHLEDTPEALRKEIDSLLETFKDPNLPGRKVLDTRKRLIEIGAPAVPRILTQFYETRTEGLTGSALQDNINYLNQLTRILRTITMHPGFGFSPARTEDGTVGITDGERQRALKGWFGWYSQVGWKRTNADYDKLREAAEEGDGDIEEWEEHKKKKRAAKGKK